MKKTLLLLVMALMVMPLRADEGMWLLPYLNKLNIKDMKAAGLKLSAQDIYNANGTSLKDAIVIFGGGCTGEVVSSEGLLLTNHHCGYGSIQSLSSVEKDYLKNGFWAMNRAEEIPAQGLTVTFIRKMSDVTDRVLTSVAQMATGEERNAAVDKNVKALIKELSEQNPGMSVQVLPFFGGNQYFAFINEVYRDVRLVGTPPSSMGKFGGDTDNWMWPRHTCDFSMFRIYASPDNKPADYSADNVPYRAPVHLSVSLKGYKEGDFTMILGFPGSTQRYMTNTQMNYMTEVDNANRIFIRGERQKILWEAMNADDKIRFQYASKYASSSNYWKNSIGMNKALKDNNIEAEKSAMEEKFTLWAETASDPEYREALPRIEAAVEAKREASGLRQYYFEAFNRAVELLSLPITFEREAKAAFKDGEIDKKALKSIISGSFYKNYSEATDRRVAKRMFAIVKERVPAAELPTIYSEVIDARFGGDTDAFVDDMYDRSLFTSPEKLDAAIDNYSAEAFTDDPAAVAMKSIMAKEAELYKEYAPYNRTINDWHRVYIKGVMEMDADDKHYPDANFTMRLTYGQVLPYEPRDGVIYKYYTTLEGVVEKEDTSNPLEFTVPDKVKEAYYSQDYGRYGEKGSLHTDFITNNDITGGNSGSPVLGARGELLGLAFDGNWEAMSGDIVFEPELQRCINVDIRYVLWTIDVFAGAPHLIDEMTIVK